MNTGKKVVQRLVAKEPMENRKNTIFSKSEIKKKIRRETEKEKEPLDSHMNDRSHMNITSTIIFGEYWTKSRKKQKNRLGICDEDFSEQESPNTEPQT